MNAAQPWSVKGIDPKAREVAKDLARRSGMTLGEWLNTVIMEDGDEDEAPTGRRAYSPDRRPASRRDEFEDQVWMRLGASVDALASRLESAEKRSTVAIQGVDQAVSGLMRQIEGQEDLGRAHDRRLGDISDELKEGHRRLRQFEQDVVPQTTEQFKKVEGSIAAVTGRLYDIEERQRVGANDLRQRMDTVEKAATSGTSGAEMLSQVSARLDAAQARTTDALKGLEMSFAGLDQRLRTAEGRMEPEGARETSRLERMAETLSRQIEENRAEMLRRLDTAQAENRIERIERAVEAMNDQMRMHEERQARAIEGLGVEIVRIAENLNGRVDRQTEKLGEIEKASDPIRLGQQLDQRLTQYGQVLNQQIRHAVVEDIKTQTAGDYERFTKGVEQRLIASEDRTAVALEKLGGDIATNSDRLNERVAFNERRATQIFGEIERRIAEATSKLEQSRADAEIELRLKEAEVRAEAIVAEARETIEARSALESDPEWSTEPFPARPFMGVETPSSFFSDPTYAAEQEEWSSELAPPAIDDDIDLSAEDDRVIAAEARLDALIHGPRIDDADEALFADSDIADIAEAARPDVEPIDEEPIDIEAIIRKAREEMEREGIGQAASPAPNLTAAKPFGSDDFGGADVDDVFEALAPETRKDTAPTAEIVAPDFSAGRTSARATLEAGRAAIARAETAASARRSSGRHGARSTPRAANDSGTFKKAIAASAIAATVTAGVALGYSQVTGADIGIPGFPFEATETAAMPTAALATTTTPADTARGAQVYSDAMTAMAEGKPNVVGLLEQSANLGYAPAQLQLADLYQKGEQGVEADPTQARLWVRRAADAGDPKAMHNYGLYLYDGIGGEQNKAEALNWMKRAAERGLTDSQFNVAQLYENGDQGIRANLTEAYKWYLIAARAGDDDAQAAVERLRAAAPEATRRQAREAADKFQVEPLAG